MNKKELCKNTKLNVLWRAEDGKTQFFYDIIAHIQPHVCGSFKAVSTAGFSTFHYDIVFLLVFCSSFLSFYVNKNHCAILRVCMIHKHAFKMKMFKIREIFFGSIWFSVERRRKVLVLSADQRVH